MQSTEANGTIQYFIYKLLQEKKGVDGVSFVTQLIDRFFLFRTDRIFQAGSIKQIDFIKTLFSL